MSEKNGSRNSSKKAGIANTTLLKKIINILEVEKKPMNITMIEKWLNYSVSIEKARNGLLFLIRVGIVRKVWIKRKYFVSVNYFYEIDPLWVEFKRLKNNKTTIREVNYELD